MIHDPATAYTSREWSLISSVDDDACAIFGNISVACHEAPQNGRMSNWLRFIHSQAMIRLGKGLFRAA